MIVPRHFLGLLLILSASAIISQALPASCPPKAIHQMQFMRASALYLFQPGHVGDLHLHGSRFPTAHHCQLYVVADTNILEDRSQI
jgi:hypothetical protein